MIDGLELPQQWRWATFGEVADIASDLVDPTLTPNAVHIAPNHIESWTGKLLPFTTVAEDGVKSPKQRFWPGQILYSKIRPYLAKAALATFEGLCSADMYPVAAKIDARFLLHWILTPWFTNETARNQGRTILPKINRNALDRLPVPVAPLNEQRRIVAKIEELFSDLDAGVVALERAKANLRRYRAAVLKAAVEGSLTAEWRARHPNVEPASKLLERILAERRSKWEAEQIAKFKAVGKEPPKNWKAKYVEPSPPDTTNLPDLPKGWCWANIDQVVAKSEYGTSVKCDYSADGVPVLRIPNIAAGCIDLLDIKYAVQPVNLSDGDEILPGDMLMCRTNGSIRLIGKAAVVKEPLKVAHSFASYLLRFRFAHGPILPFWIHAYISSVAGRRFIEGNAASSAGQHNISLSLISRMPIPLPPNIEQSVLIDEINERLTQADASDVGLGKSLLRAGRLRQSILKQAFEGKLVHQDPKDEPASVLLKRIKANYQPHEANGKPVKTTPRKAKQKTS